jgi:hypothetical protein
MYVTIALLALSTLCIVAGAVLMHAADVHRWFKGNRP